MENQSRHLKLLLMTSYSVQGHYNRNLSRRQYCHATVTMYLPHGKGILSLPSWPHFPSSTANRTRKRNHLLDYVRPTKPSIKRFSLRSGPILILRSYVVRTLFQTSQSQCTLLDIEPSRCVTWIHALPPLPIWIWGWCRASSLLQALSSWCILVSYNWRTQSIRRKLCNSTTHNSANLLSKWQDARGWKCQILDVMLDKIAPELPTDSATASTRALLAEPSPAKFLVEQWKDLHFRLIRLIVKTPCSDYSYNLIGLLIGVFTFHWAVPIVFLQSLQLCLLMSHYPPPAGHLAELSMYDIGGRNVYWPCLENNVYRTKKDCSYCARKKLRAPKRNTWYSSHQAARLCLSLCTYLACCGKQPLETNLWWSWHINASNWHERYQCQRGMWRKLSPSSNIITFYRTEYPLLAKREWRLIFEQILQNPLHISRKNHCDPKKTCSHSLLQIC